MENREFRELFQRLVERYELAPEIAEALLQRILRILAHWDQENGYFGKE